MSDRSQKIDAIIAARKPIAEKTAKKIEQLNDVSDSIRRCNNLIDVALQRQLTDEQRSILQTSQTELQHFVNEEIPKYVQNLGQLQQRFGRDTLNIGVVGNARQGKSTLLQALTGLTSEEIPAAETDHCTGAPSVIINDTQTYANVEFYSEQALYEDVILPFYDILKLSPKPVSVRDFESNPLPALQSASETDKQLYAKLQNRYEHFGKYRALLNQPNKRIERHEFLDYIAQQKNGGKIYNWVAVKMVTIRCPFKIADAGRLSVCDSPGLGDFVCGAEDNLVRNIGKNLDTVVMLKRVPNGGIVKPEDTQLFDLIPKAIPELPPKDWSYFIVNRSGTDAELAEFQKQVGEKIITRKLITLDARKSDEVLQHFDEILQDVADNQAALDKKIYDARVASVASLLSEITKSAKNLSRVFPTANNAANRDYTTAQTMFGQEVWGNLAYELKELVKRYEKERDNENLLFTSILKEIESKLIVVDENGNTRFFCLPSEKEFAKKAASTQATSAYGDYCQIFRRNVIKTFEQIDKGIESTNEGIKSFFDKLRDEVKQCFTSEDGGKFANITFSPSTSDAEEVNVADDTAVWLSSLADEITLLGDTPKSRETAKQIAVSLRQFASAMLKFREFILPRILPCFDVLNSSSDAHRPFLPASWEAPAATLITNIDAAAKKAVSDAAGKIREYAKEPSMALFATVEDVCDAVLRTDSEESSKSIWKNFAAEHRSEIFPDIFQQKEADTKFRKEWNEAAAKLQQSVNAAN